MSSLVVLTAAYFAFSVFLIFVPIFSFLSSLKLVGFKRSVELACIRFIHTLA